MLKKIRKMLKSQEGFTLVELMIVVVILGIISGIGIQQYGNVQKKAKDSVYDANVKMILSAIEMYRVVEGKDPANIAALKGYGIDEAPKSPYDETVFSFTISGGTVTISPPKGLNQDTEPAEF